MIFLTVCNKSELAAALTLIDSVKTFHAESKMVLGWVDADAPELPAGVRCIPVTQLDFAGKWSDMQRRYYDFELVAACRPWFARELLSEGLSEEHLVFLAPTCELYRPISLVYESEADFWLTPNIIKPLPAQRALSDRHILNMGIFNANSWALRPSAETAEALAWWADRTIDRAKLDMCNGMCLDQLWLNYIPSWLEKTEIVRRSGWHVGLHSFPFQGLEKQGGKFVVGQEELLMADYAGIFSYHPIWSDFKGLAGASRVFEEMVGEYRKRLAKNSPEMAQEAPAYGQRANVSRIRNPRRAAARIFRNWAKWIDETPLGQ